MEQIRKEANDEAKQPPINYRWVGLKHLPNHWDEQFEDSAVPPIWGPNMTVDPELPGPTPWPRPYFAT